MSLIGGVLDLASSIVSAASHGGGDSSPKMETKDGGKGLQLDAGPVQVSIDDQGLSVKVDGKEVAKLDLHSKDTFEAPKPPPPLANLFDEKSGIGSKPAGAGDGRA